MAYTTIDKPNLYFDSQLWTGTNASGRTFTGLNFRPDFIYNKCYNSANYYLNMVDIVRGGTKFLATPVTSVEDTASHGQITSFNSNGTTWADGTNATYPRLYYNDGAGSTLGGSQYVSWNWSCGGTGVSNTSGTITSTVSANTTSGCSIVSYTGNGTGNSTIGHGLGAVPKFIIVKSRTSADAWGTLSASFVSAADPNILYLNSTAAEADDTNVWGTSANFTSSTFTVGTWNGSNANATDYIAYCWSEIKGYSKFGSYVGNSSADGTFVYTGFKPAFIMVKNKNYGPGTDWFIFDNKRNTYNVENLYLSPNLPAAEATGVDTDFLSNGFKLRHSSIAMNNSSYTYIYMAFAENPFVTSTQIPTTAR